jgi:hypothetical protein
MATPLPERFSEPKDVRIRGQTFWKIKWKMSAMFQEYIEGSKRNHVVWQYGELQSIK